MGIGKAHGFDDGWIAGSIITGAYFGDKLSPLSDTTVLASSVSGTPLFTHIRYMLFTTVPTFCISLTVFLIAGLTMNVSGHGNVTEFLEGLQHTCYLTLAVVGACVDGCDDCSSMAFHGSAIPCYPISGSCCFTGTT